MNQTESPIQESRTIISIAAILVGAVCFVGGLNGWPVLTPVLAWISGLVYSHFPALSGLKAPQIPLLASAAVVGCAVWVVGIPFAGLIAQGFSSGQVAQMERQTRKLKKNRARIKTKQRRQDDFTAY
jgi:hypothetical protein